MKERACSMKINMNGRNEDQRQERSSRLAQSERPPVKPEYKNMNTVALNRNGQNMKAGEPVRREEREPAQRKLKQAQLRTRPRTGRPGRWNFRRSGSSSGGLATAAALAVPAALAVLLAAVLASSLRAPQPQPPAPAHAVPATAPAAVPAAAPGAAQPGTPAPAAAEPELPVRVYLTQSGSVETLPLEQYVTGVVAAEMPADFELSALKAQAIAARTYIVRRLAANDTSGIPGGKADVKDTVEHQAYISRDQLEEWRKNGNSEKLSRLERAVKETRGIVMTYHGEPITASFFSASGGYTENSEEYWSLKIPYLRSVPSPWESSINPANEVTTTITYKDMLNKLGHTRTSVPVTAKLSTKNQRDSILKVVSYTSGRRVKEIIISGQEYSGREVREKLRLRSSQFTMKIEGDEVKITTYGSGHGVGMSQWGANGMAKEGYTATQILKHYYTGITFEKASQILK